RLLRLLLDPVIEHRPDESLAELIDVLEARGPAFLGHLWVPLRGLGVRIHNGTHGRTRSPSVLGGRRRRYFALRIRNLRGGNGMRRSSAGGLMVPVDGFE